jgi:hypothetical protein
VAIARIIDADLHDSAVRKALFFHARRVSPGWRLTRVGTVGNHVFYRSASFPSCSKDRTCPPLPIPCRPLPVFRSFRPSRPKWRGA